ncbi:MAG: hypothetical protein LBV55_03130 [Acholeplasmatales bacterium]|jgi:GGDEF domain-containing protein|nr:hypothetical protein [Acholeplasmatales bacterium]
MALTLLIVASFVVAAIIIILLNKIEPLRVLATSISVSIFILLLTNYFYDFLPNLYLYFFFIPLVILIVWLVYYLVRDHYLNSLNSYILNMVGTNAFIILNKHYRILRMSDNLVKVIAPKKEFRNLFKVLNKNIRLMEINQKNANNGDLENEIYLFANSQKTKKSLNIAFKDLSGNTKYFIIDLIKLDHKQLKGFLLIGDLKNSLQDLATTTQADEQIMAKIIGRDFKHSADYKYILDFNSNSVFLSLKLKELLGVAKQTILTNEFNYLLKESEAKERNKMISELNEDFYTYQVSYQIKVKGVDRYVQEEGTKLFGLNPRIIAYLRLIPMEHFESTRIEILDQLPLKEEMINQVNLHLKNDEFFQVFSFSPISIKDINEHYTREIGNYVLGEVIKHFQEVLDTKIYRLGGLVFATLIYDAHQIHKLKNLKPNNEYFARENIILGANNLEVLIKAGLSTYPYDAIKKTSYEIINNSVKALKSAINSNVGIVDYRRMDEK